MASTIEGQYEHRFVLLLRLLGIPASVKRPRAIAVYQRSVERVAQEVVSDHREFKVLWKLLMKSLQLFLDMGEYGWIGATVAQIESSLRQPAQEAGHESPSARQLRNQGIENQPMIEVPVPG
jgi:hypothetical protein